MILDVMTLEDGWLDQALWQHGVAPPEVRHVGCIAKGPQFGVYKRESLAVASWWSPTECWDDCMPLAWRYQVGILPLSHDVIVAAHPSWRQTLITTEREARTAMCRLVLLVILEQRGCTHVRAAGGHP